jgi:hypothetical protein
MEGTARRPEVALGRLLPCPFCGRGATVEADRWRGESVRIACSNDSCRVRPRTEYLLPAYAEELCAAWNGRATVPASTAMDRAEATG